VTAATLTYERARPDDDPVLRALMRDNPMAGTISVAFTREPDFFAAAAIEGRHQTMVARAGDTPVAVFGRSTRMRWVGGSPRRVGYLSSLRVDPAWRGRPGMFRRGFDLVRRVHAEEGDAEPWLFTSIIEDNAPARRLLEANVPGFPTYQPIGVFCTLALPTWRRRQGRIPARSATEADREGIVACLDRNLSRTDLAPAWTADDLCGRDLSISDFVVVERHGRIAAVCALWDQSRFKQTIVASYAGGIGHVRGLLNAAAPLLGVPRLPPPGGPLVHGYLSHLAVDDDAPDLALAVLAEAHGRAVGRGWAYVMTGLAERHPLRTLVSRHFGAMEYRAVLYTVSFDGPISPIARLPHVEIAIL
jgi:hypothetical protein